SDLKQDQFQLYGEFIEGTAYDRVVKFLDLIRNKGDRLNLFAHIQSENAVPTAAGFASSASGFAALAGAATKALEMDIDLPALSSITRQGSGSACRSVYGGFVEWQKGEREDGSDSFAVPIAPLNHWDLRIAAVVLTAKEKEDRKSTRLNSSHVSISYAVFCLKKKR